MEMVISSPKYRITCPRCERTYEFRADEETKIPPYPDTMAIYCDKCKGFIRTRGIDFDYRKKVKTSTYWKGGFGAWIEK